MKVSHKFGSVSACKTPYTPSLHDEVWKLEKIDKDGAFCECLSKERIYTVKDFLIQLSLDQENLRNALGIIGMSDDIWDITVAHAQTCILEKEVYFYSPSMFQNKIGVAFNVVAQAIGLLSGEQFITSDKFCELQKEEAHNLISSALRCWEEVKKFDDETSCLNGISPLCTAQFSSNSLLGVVNTNEASTSRASYACEVGSDFDLGPLPISNIFELPLRSPLPDGSFTDGGDFTANKAVIGDGNSDLFASSWPTFDVDMDYNDNSS